MKELKPIKGLPNYYKKVAGVLVLIAVGLLFLLKFLGVEKELGLKIVFSLITISGFLFITAKEKIEDERIERVRLMSFTSAFLFMVGYSVTGTFLVEKFNVFSLIFSGILAYIFVFYTQRRKL